MAATGAQRRRVALVIGQLTYGGAESQLYELARGLPPEWEPIVYCLCGEREPYGTRLEEAGVRLRVLPSRGSFDVGRVVALGSALRQDAVDVVHSWLFLASAYVYLANPLAGGLPVVAAARNCKPEPNRLKRLIMRRAYRAANRVLCNSGEMAEFATAYYSAAPRRVRVVYNGVEMARFGPRQGGAAGLRIGTIGRIEAQKNLPLFVEAAAAILQHRPDAVFEIVGAGSLSQAVEDDIRRRGIQGSVHLRGQTEDVPGFLAGLDQFWLTSDWEGTPNVVLEAMAAGVPVVATAVGGTPEIVEDGRTGRLVPAGDCAALVRASLEIAGDENLAGALGSSAREQAARRFSIPAMVAATTAVYEEALADR